MRWALRPIKEWPHSQVGCHTHTLVAHNSVYLNAAHPSGISVPIIG